MTTDRKNTNTNMDKKDNKNEKYEKRKSPQIFKTK